MKSPSYASSKSLGPLAKPKSIKKIEEFRLCSASNCAGGVLLY